MDFLSLAKKRCSIRSYKTRQVEEEKLNNILEAGRVAPTGKNCQGQKFLVIRSQEGMKKLSKACKTHGAPMAIVVLCDSDNVFIRPYDEKRIIDIDATIATDHMMHMATEQGLGTCWICFFKPDVLKEEFNIPENLVPVNILVMGYTEKGEKSSDRHDTERKSLSEFVVNESF